MLQVASLDLGAVWRSSRFEAFKDRSHGAGAVITTFPSVDAGREAAFIVSGVQTDRTASRQRLKCSTSKYL